ncbi:MAG: CRISPR-associated endonuclease Cas2 [Clostridia bacterium]|nr:CRISPR-associated endonuclease Cas2 [Clostridia bacterium]
MKTLVVYDIPDDRVRTKVFEACKDYGLSHIQYSAFFGELNHNRRQELYQRLRRVLGQNEGKILICPICDKDIALMLEVQIPDSDPVSKKGISADRPLIY